MAVYVFPDANGSCAVHYLPVILTPEEKANGFEVALLPEPEQIPGKIPVLKGDITTKQVWYEYQEQILTDEEKRVQQLEQAVADISQLLLEKGVI